MIALGGPKLKLVGRNRVDAAPAVSMIALGGPKLKRRCRDTTLPDELSFNDSTGWA